MELQAVGPNHFYIAQIGANIEFTPYPEGRMEVKITQPGSVLLGDRLAALTADELAQYAGVYWSEELEAQYTISVHEGNLVALNSHHGEIKLTQYTQDRFLSNMFYFHEVHFLRDESKNVIGLTVGGGRVNQVHFVRK